MALTRVAMGGAAMLAAVVLAACGSGSASDAPPKPALVVPTVTPDHPDLTVFRNFSFPIAGGCLPKGDQLMPNAPREYRGGVHEGVDLYEYDNCAKITKGTPALAAKDGVVVRADHAYHPLTQAELADADAKIAAGHANDFEVIDLFRGRQVWIDHGKGIITRYAHLSGIPDNIQDGTPVVAGQIVGFVGDSGTPESISSPDTENHLHWELRAGDSFLGKGLPPADVRALYTLVFEPLP